MESDLPVSPRRFRLALTLGPVVVVVGALLLGFTLSLADAARQFEHALLAQRQAAQVAILARDAAAGDRDGWRDGLAQYRALIAQEARYLAAGEGNEAEERRADLLARQGAAPGSAQALAQTARKVAADEQAEVDAARDRLDATRRHAVIWGGLLALAALAATTAGAVQLQRANRDLSREVAAQTARLEAIDRSRRLFFAKASHELQTPVATIRTMAEVALGGGDDPVATLAAIVPQTEVMGHRIAEMLSLSAAAEGRPALRRRPADLREILAQAVGQIAPLARSLDVALAGPGETGPALLRADQRWLTQGLLAVLHNAIRFSDSGGVVTIALGVAAGQARIIVADAGPGVLDPELPRIFDAYYQTETGRARGGTGLGLALARWVVDMHEGSIHAENADPGCRMVIVLPLEPGA